MKYVVVHRGGLFSGNNAHTVADQAVENHPNVENPRDSNMGGKSNAEIFKEKI